jgi:hypothetical protein
MSTIPFGPRNPPEDPLLAKAGELPKDVAPPRDLWPAIAARLQQPGEAPHKPAFRWPLALAAALLVASVSALLTWSLLRDPQAAGPAVIAQAPAAEFVPVRYGPNSGVSTAELAAVATRMALYAWGRSGVSVSGDSFPWSWTHPSSASCMSARIAATSRSATTPTTRTLDDFSARAISRARSTVTRRGELGTKLMPMAVAPRSAHASASEAVVTPQILTCIIPVSRRSSSARPK